MRVLSGIRGCHRADVGAAGARAGGRSAAAELLYFLAAVGHVGRNTDQRS